jgi:hypothetical protein
MHWDYIAHGEDWEGAEVSVDLTLFSEYKPTHEDMLLAANEDESGAMDDPRGRSVAHHCTLYDLDEEALECAVNPTAATQTK